MLIQCLLIACALSHNHLASQAMDDLAYLSQDALAGRKTAEQGAQLAANYIKRRFKEIKLKPFKQRYLHTFSFSTGYFSKTLQGENVIAQYVTDQNAPYIIFTAHYDHLGTKGQKIYNGADDNASGVATMLAIATLLAQRDTKHNYLFVATDAEEKGLYGAKALLKDERIQALPISLNINLDMLSISSRKKRLLALYSKELASYKHIIEQKHPHHPAHIKMTTGRGFYQDSGQRLKSHRAILKASDHSEFRKAGIPYLYFGVGTHKHYHQPSDEFDNVDHAFYRANIENLLTMIEHLDQAWFDADAH